MIVEKAKIVDNRQLAENIWEMIFISDKIADNYVGAGQFVSVLVNDTWEHPIRRPMSIAEVSDNNISIIYKVIGSVTSSLTHLISDDYINVLGPLGNTFVVDYDTYYPIFIGGGIGLSPIINLSKCLTLKGVPVYTIIGAITSKEHFIEHEPENNIYLSTDDGTVGIAGTVIDALNIVLNDINNPKIFACGPEPMLSSIQNELKDKMITAQFSVESYMACGVGLCQGCAIPKINDNEYYLVCKDGPVFEANEVNFG